VLKVSETERSELGTPPCFRCLFEKPISDCNPEICDMLESWLMGMDVSEWAVRLELKYVEKAKSPERI
jgi:hypothetical protein